MIDTEKCWITGQYDGAECEFCEHKNECSGYEDNNDDKFDDVVELEEDEEDE